MTEIDRLKASRDFSTYDNAINNQVYKRICNVKKQKREVCIDQIKFECLNVVPLDDVPVNEDEGVSTVFKHPFFAVFLGPSRSGKTTTWINLLKNKNLFYEKFEEIYYYIATWNDDPIYDDNLDVDPRDIILEYDPAHLEAIIEGKKRMSEHLTGREDGKKRVIADQHLPPCLVVVDDNVGTKGMSSRAFTLIDILATKGRKFNISVILSIQFLRNVLSTIARANVSDLCIFYLPNADEQERVLKEFRGNLTKEEIKAMYDACFQSERDKHNFLYIQNFNTNRNTKCRKNFNTFLRPVYPPDEENQFNTNNMLPWIKQECPPNLFGMGKKDPSKYAQEVPSEKDFSAQMPYIPLNYSTSQKNTNTAAGAAAAAGSKSPEGPVIVQPPPKTYVAQKNETVFRIVLDIANTINFSEEGGEDPDDFDAINYPPNFYNTSLNFKNNTRFINQYSEKRFRAITALLAKLIRNNTYTTYENVSPDNKVSPKQFWYDMGAESQSLSKKDLMLIDQIAVENFDRKYVQEQIPLAGGSNFTNIEGYNDFIRKFTRDKSHMILYEGIMDISFETRRRVVNQTKQKEKIREMNAQSAPQTSKQSKIHELLKISRERKEEEEQEEEQVENLFHGFNSEVEQQVDQDYEFEQILQDLGKTKFSHIQQ